MAKMNVYIPDELKAEMDAAGKLAPNWSAVAQEAFRLECQRIANRKRGGKMSAVVERLRESKERLANQDKVQGHAAGRKWAAEQAQYDELARVAKWQGPDSNIDDIEVYWLAYQVIVNDERPDASDCNQFWTTVAGSEAPSEDFVIAFALGAEEVFDEVDDKL
jgi:hypothetical protein